MEKGNSMNLSILLSTSALLFTLVIIGTILCLPLYKWDIRALLRSHLFTKIIWWIPLYLILLGLLFLELPFATLLVIALLILAFKEFRRHASQPPQFLETSYLVFFTLASFSIILIFGIFPTLVAVHLTLIISFASVLSDVCAFFFGKYLPKHSLPHWINPGKSWEGVAGQVIGAFVGAALLYIATGIEASWLLILAIGVASAAGDLFNSVVKRKLDIKDWGNTIPGHGGVLDRMSSLSTAFFVSFWLLFISLFV